MRNGNHCASNTYVDFIYCKPVYLKTKEVVMQLRLYEITVEEGVIESVVCVEVMQICAK